MRVSSALLLALALLALLPAQSRATISQRELRGIFLHHQEYCRERAVRVGAGGVRKRHWVAHQTQEQCERSNGAHEWFRDEAAIEEDDAFRVRAEGKRRNLRTLGRTGAPADHVYLARITRGTVVSTLLRDALKARTGITFEDFFRGDSEDSDGAASGRPREYLMFFASETVSTADADAASELARLEAQPEIDAVMPLPPRWKLSPLLLGDDGHDDDTTPDALKTLKVRVADRAKAHHGDAVSTTASTLTAPQRFTMAELSSQLIDVLRNFEYPAFSSSSSSDTGTPTPTYPFFRVASAGAEAASLFGDDVARAEHAAESSDWLVVDNVPALHLDAIALHIATQFAPALRIEPTLLHLTSNAWARWVTQSYTNAATDPTLNVLPVGTRTTVWDRGIQGENQIVGVGDSGLAVKNCQFVDPGRPVGPVQTGTTLNDNAHRKVIQYVAYADGGAGDNEDHGTHVSGSVAGKTPQGGKLGAYDGMAPEAKLAFFDIGRPGERGLRVPNDLATSFFPLAYGVGAKIHTNSWGSNTATYTASSRSLDRFMFDNQDFLVLVAAGNSGRDGAGSVGSPATAKSALSVGASLGTQESFQKNNVNNPPCGGGACTENMASFSSLGPLPSDSRLKPEVSAPGALTYSARSNTADVYQCPNSEQESAQWTEQQIRAVIFPTQGTSMATPTTAGNAALVRQYFTDGWYPRGSADAAQAQLPTGALLKAMLINSAQPMTGNHGNQALGGGQAGNLPAATGAQGRAGANIVRSRPTYAQRNLNGFGLTVLDRTLAFADSTGASVVRQDLFAVGFMGDASGSGLSQASLKTGDQPDEYTFTIKAAPPGAGAIPFKATLVWTDAPAATSAGKALVNDLDLEVTVTGPAGAPDLGTVYVPNGYAQSEVDSINPTEQVEIYNAEVGKTYNVKINPRQIVTPHPSTGGQPYALVVTGSFEKDANLFPTAAPVVSTSSSQIVLGEKNRFTVQGQNFAATGNTAELTCSGTNPIPAVSITASTQTLVTIEIGSSSWTCPGGSVMGVITAGGGFSSAPTQIAVAVGSDAITGGGTVVIGADGFAQVVPGSSSARENVCGTFIDEDSCSKIEFCLWDVASQTCYSEPLVSAGVVVVIVLVVIALITACYVYFVGCFGFGGGGGGHASEQGKEQPPVVAMTFAGAGAGAPPPPPNKPSQAQRPLQAGWVGVVDKASGDTYYFNKSTGATTWERHLIEA